MRRDWGWLRQGRGRAGRDFAVGRRALVSGGCGCCGWADEARLGTGDARGGIAFGMVARGKRCYGVVEWMGW